MDKRVDDRAVMNAKDVLQWLYETADVMLSVADAYKINADSFRKNYASKVKKMIKEKNDKEAMNLFNSLMRLPILNKAPLKMTGEISGGTLSHF